MEKKELFKALAAFQQECPVIKKETEGYGYNYADLPSIIEIINPLLKKNGLSFTQPLEFTDGVRVIRTILIHLETGQTLESTVDVPVVSLGKMNDYQALGSGITYMRRYSLSSVLGIVGDEDNDAAGEQTATQKAQPKNDKPKWITDKEVERYVHKIKEGEYKDMDADSFIANLRKHFAVNKKHEETLRIEFKFEETLNA